MADCSISEDKRARANAATRRWYNKNKAYVAEYNHRVYWADPEQSRRRHKESQRRWKAANPERHRELNFKSKYGITFAERDAMLVAQGNKCAACGTSEPGGKYKTWHMDHCHKTKRNRGILCHGCNVSLGHMKDDPEKIRCLADYIERHTP